MKNDKRFFLVGAAKAGTSSLYELLARHPQIFVPSVKEPHYFAFPRAAPDFRGPGDDRSINRTAVTDPARYRDLFQGASPYQLCGDASVSYLYVPGTAGRIAAEYPHARILGILRNPVERAHSSYLYMKSRGREPASSFVEALRQEEERIAAGWQHIFHYYHMGLYGEQVEAYLREFPAEQVRFLVYDDLRADPRGTVREAQEFLGLDLGVDLGALERRNVSGVPRHRILKPLLRDVGLVGRAARRVIPRSVRRRFGAFLRGRALRRPPLDPGVARELGRRYQEDLSRLEGALGRPLPVEWRAFPA